MLKKLRW